MSLDELHEEPLIIIIIIIIIITNTYIAHFTITVSMRFTLVP